MKKFVVLTLALMMGAALIGCDSKLSFDSSKNEPKGKLESVEVPPKPGTQEAEKPQVQSQKVEQVQSQKVEQVQTQKAGEKPVQK